AVDQIRSVLNEPLTAALEIRVAIEGVGRHCCDAKHGNETDHGAGAHGKTPMLEREQVVVEEAVLLIPERPLRIVPAVHGVRNVDVMLPELTRDALIHWG